MTISYNFNLILYKNIIIYNISIYKKRTIYIKWVILTISVNLHNSNKKVSYLTSLNYINGDLTLIIILLSPEHNSKMHIIINNNNNSSILYSSKMIMNI